MSHFLQGTQCVSTTLGFRGRTAMNSIIKEHAYKSSDYREIVLLTTIYSNKHEVEYNVYFHKDGKTKRKSGFKTFEKALKEYNSYLTL